MGVRWGVLSSKTGKWLKTGWLIAAGLVALYIGVIAPRERARGIASERASGLAAVAGGVGWEPISLWHQSSILPHFARMKSVDKGVIGGVPGGVSVDRASVMTYVGGGGGGAGQEESAPDRKLVRTATLGLIVKTPAETAKRSSS
jgi:hypothetical protein